MRSIDEAIGLVGKFLWEGEEVEFCIRQSRIPLIGGSITSPVLIVATSKRLVIINRIFFGLRNDYEMWDYRQIIGIRVVKGLFTSSICVRTHSFEGEALQDFNKSNNMIHGINRKDEERLSDHLNRILALVHQPIRRGQFGQLPHV